MEELLKEILYELKRMNNPPNRIFTTKELAEYFQVDVHRISDLRESGLLKAFKIGREYKFAQKEVDKFIDKYGDCDLSNIQAMKLVKKSRS